MAALCVLASCSNSSKQEKADSSSADSVQTSVMSFQDCDLTLAVFTSPRCLMKPTSR